MRQRWALIVGCGLAAAVLAFGFSLVMPERYKASADLLFEKSNLDAAVLGSDTAAESQTAPERVAATNLELASLQVVAENARRRLGTSLTVRQLQDRISIKPKGQADIVTITATAPTREEAVRIANTFAEEVEAFRRRAAQDQVQRAIDALRLSQATASSVTTRGAERLEQVQAIKEVEAGDVTIVQRAVPPREASSPRPLRNSGSASGGSGASPTGIPPGSVTAVCINVAWSSVMQLLILSWSDSSGREIRHGRSLPLLDAVSLPRHLTRHRRCVEVSSSSVLLAIRPVLDRVAHHLRNRGAWLVRHSVLPARTALSSLAGPC